MTTVTIRKMNVCGRKIWLEREKVPFKQTLTRFSSFRFTMFATVASIVVIYISVSDVQGQSNFKCPTKNGYYPDKEQCDLYYECRNGNPKPKLCDDGMAFIWANNPLYGKCDVITNVDCGGRPYLQQAKETPHCPRANGYYRHEKWPKICDEFYQCDKGKVKLLKCQAGLAFDPITSGCQWAAKVEGCEYLADKLPKPPGHAEPQYEDDYEDEPQSPPPAKAPVQNAPRPRP